MFFACLLKVFAGYAEFLVLGLELFLSCLLALAGCECLFSDAFIIVLACVILDVMLIYFCDFLLLILFSSDLIISLTLQLIVYLIRILGLGLFLNCYKPILIITKQHICILKEPKIGIAIQLILLKYQLPFCLFKSVDLGESRVILNVGYVLDRA